MSAAGNDPSSFDESDASDDPRLLAAVREYMAAVDAGRPPNRKELLARHPDIAAELSVCLHGLAFLNNAVAEVDADTTAPSPAADPALHQPLGDFQLIREIGRGGMGVVYEAMQLSLGRPVAVKVLPLAAALDQRHLQRFRNEAQAAAQLHHTNIVPVYAVGCERSIHYYAMQLINGQSVADLIRQLRPLSPADRESETISLTSRTTLPPSRQSRFGDPGSFASRCSRTSSDAITPSASPLERIAPHLSSATHNLSTLHAGKRADYFRSVARLGVQAAEALDYAHGVGVVHRDIKPANLLIDAGGNLWVTDFGLAQIYGDVGLTQPGDVLGTYRYMSPEQASGRAAVLDQRTDVYSLGVTLYEMLTLQPAMAGRTREALLGEIANVDPKPPRAIDRTIPVELQTIVAKAVAKEPLDRYPGARALADDLLRFLRDEPIRARPPSAWDQAVKWTRRHRGLALSTIALLVVITAGSIVGAALLAREEARTKAALITAQVERRRAEDNFTQAREAVDFLTQVATDELPPDPATADARERLLTTALEYYQSFLADHSANPAVATELAAAEARVSSLLAELATADRMFRLSFELRLLDEQSVQRELKLSSEQTDQVQRVRDAVPRFGPMPQRRMASTQQASDLARQSEIVEGQLSAILTAAQAGRLRQISRQLRGMAAFDDPEVAGALNLTAAQRSSLTKLRSTDGPRGPMFRGPGGGGPHPWNDRFNGNGGPFRPDAPRPDAPPPTNDGADGGPTSRRQTMLADAINLLTPDQQKMWATLTGPRFDGNISMFHHGGFGARPD